MVLNPIKLIADNQDSEEAIYKYAEYLYRVCNITSENYVDLYDNMGGGLKVETIKKLQKQIDKFEGSY